MGATSPKTQVISIYIYEHVETLEYGLIYLLSVGLLIFSFVVLSVLYAINKRSRGVFDMNTMHIALQLKRHTCNVEVDLTVPTQGITALFGPSGSGKTTILRCLAGLDRITQARVRVGESTWQDEQVFVPTPPPRLGLCVSKPAFSSFIRQTQP